MLYQYSNVHYLMRQTQKKQYHGGEREKRWIFSNTEQQENWETICYNRLESCLEGKGGFKKDRKSLKSQRQSDSRTDCSSLRALPAGKQHFLDKNYEKRENTECQNAWQPYIEHGNQKNRLGTAMAQFTIPLLKYIATEEQITVFSYKDSRIQILEKEEFGLTK